MKDADLWDIARPQDEAFTDIGAFGQRTMSFDRPYGSLLIVG